MDLERQRLTEMAFALDDIGDKLGDVYLTLDNCIKRLGYATKVEGILDTIDELREARETINALIAAAESA